VKTVNIEIKEVKPVGILKEDLSEESFSLLLWVRLIKNEKDKFLCFCIRNYCFYDWPLSKLILHSYIKNDRGEVAGSMVFRELLPLTYILNNLLYINAEIYTRFSGNLYKKNEALTKENVLTKAEESTIREMVCSHIYNLDKRKKEYYKQQLEKLITKNYNKIKECIPNIMQFGGQIFYFPVMHKKELILINQ